jgi:branched-chain amino acid transport system ATP-binding protein
MAESNGNAALVVDSLDVRYSGVPAVSGASFEVGRGEIVGLVGPNGAGKTSTLMAIMGAVPVRGGDVIFEGRSLRGLSTENIVRSGVALVPEGRHIFSNLSVDENLRLGLVGRRSNDDVDADLERITSLFPVVREFAQRPAAALSGGQQQQLAIARALLAKPDLLILDEPSLGLAPNIVAAVWDALAEIRRQGVTILLVEQRAQITVSFAERTYVMANGQIRMTLTPEEADNTDRMVKAYFG